MKKIGTRNGPWSDSIALENISDQTPLRSNRLWSDSRIRLWSDFSDQIDPWSDQLQNMVQTVVRSKFRPDPVISV